MLFDVTVPEPIVRWLDGQPGSVADLGGKGAGLNRLRALGAPVPRAAAIPTPVYRSFAKSHEIPLTLGTGRSGDPAAIRQVILEAPLPEMVEVELRQAGEILSVQPGRLHAGVAVRSSATSEDSAECAFAGLHDTILNVDPTHGLEMAVRQCWASLWSDRAVAYRHEQGLQHVSLEMAVVIQEMAFSDVSFVGFAADPISGNRDTVLITATWGLCEAVVAGLVVPDEIRVDQCGQVIDYRIGTKHQMVISSEQGVRCVPVPRLLQTQPAIDSDTAQVIATTIRTLSAGLGFPADVEGGIEHGKLQFFQARPITTLPASSFHGGPVLHQEAYRHVEARHRSAS